MPDAPLAGCVIIFPAYTVTLPVGLLGPTPVRTTVSSVGLQTSTTLLPPTYIQFPSVLIDILDIFPATFAELNVATLVIVFD